MAASQHGDHGGGSLTELRASRDHHEVEHAGSRCDRPLRRAIHSPARLRERPEARQLVLDPRNRRGLAGPAQGRVSLRWSSQATTIPGIEHELARFWALPQARAAVDGPAERTIAARTSVLNLCL